MESGEQGTQHFQGYLEFFSKARKRFAWLKAHVFRDGQHFEFSTCYGKRVLRKKQGLLARGTSESYQEIVRELFNVMRLKVIRWWLLSGRELALRRLLEESEKIGNLAILFMLSSCLPISGKREHGRARPWYCTILEELEKACWLPPSQSTSVNHD